MFLKLHAAWQSRTAADIQNSIDFDHRLAYDLGDFINRIINQAFFKCQRHNPDRDHASPQRNYENTLVEKQTETGLNPEWRECIRVWGKTVGRLQKLTVCFGAEASLGNQNFTRFLHSYVASRTYVLHHRRHPLQTGEVWRLSQPDRWPKKQRWQSFSKIWFKKQIRSADCGVFEGAQRQDGDP